MAKYFVPVLLWSKSEHLDSFQKYCRYFQQTNKDLWTNFFIFSHQVNVQIMNMNIWPSLAIVQSSSVYQMTIIIIQSNQRRIHIGPLSIFCVHGPIYDHKAFTGMLDQCAKGKCKQGDHKNPHSITKLLKCTMEIKERAVATTFVDCIQAWV